MAAVDDLETLEIVMKEAEVGGKRELYGFEDTTYRGSKLVA